MFGGDGTHDESWQCGERMEAQGRKLDFIVAGYKAGVMCTSKLKPR